MFLHHDGDGFLPFAVADVGIVVVNSGMGGQVNMTSHKPKIK